jgi:hypothetical protein
MDLLVQIEIVAKLAGVVQPFHPPLQMIEPFKVAFGHAQRCELCRDAFDAADGLEQFLDFILADRRDDRAAIEAKLDQPFGG